MSKYFIGLMTGTSADSIDGCVVDFTNRFELIQSRSMNLEKNYKPKYEEAIKKGFKNKMDDEIVFELEESLNKSSVELIKHLLEEIDAASISGIGFPGQTMFHDTERSYQIGCAQYIADEVGIKVIHDFRNYDLQKEVWVRRSFQNSTNIYLLNQTKEKLFSISEEYLMALT